MDGVRETACTGCIHREVCGFKEKYINMISKLNKIFYEEYPDENKFMTLIDPACKYYHCKATPKNTEENMNRLLSPEELFGRAKELFETQPVEVIS